LNLSTSFFLHTCAGLGGSWHPSESKVLAVLADGKPKSHMEIAKATGLGGDAVLSVLRRYWQKGFILRAKKVIRERLRAFKGRAGVRSNLRSYYLYVLKPKGVNVIIVDGVQFVRYEERYLDKRNRVVSKASFILDYGSFERGDTAFIPPTEVSCWR